jgi:invasion protein IalB
MRRAVLTAGLVAAFCCAPAFAQTTPTLLQKFNDWAAYGTTGDTKICFAVAQPQDSSPKGAKRGPIFFYISRYPAEQVANEISVKMGYPFKPGATVTVSVGGQKFELFTKDEGAFIEKPEQEASFVEALKRGNSMKVEGSSVRGTKTTDTYSLSGISDALNRIASECGS